MPNAAPRPCKQTGCRALTSSGAYCTDHAKVRRQQADAERGSSTQRGYGYRWQKTSKAYLRAHPLCQCPDCQEGKIRLLASQVVDHITPHRGDMKLFWDPKNWQAMNKQCHDRKTATEDGGFRGANQGGGQKSGGFLF
jgi:5-methylcytosine-specific restriction protein A